MNELCVRVMQASDRPALCQMLEASEDFPQKIVYLYRRGSSRYTTFIALRDSGIAGVLTGSFDSDFHESGAFDAFQLPPAPHAFLDRIYVPSHFRGAGVGQALVGAYADEAAARGCTFIGGSVDLSSEPTQRKAFFERLGFAVRELDNFGARPDDVLK